MIPTVTATVTVAVALLLAQQAPVRDAPPTAAGAAGRITGVITSDEAQPRPLRRARVTLVGSGPGAEYFDSVITGDDGRFTFERLPPARYTLTAAKDAYVGMSYGASSPGRSGTGIPIAPAQAASVTMRLARGAVITGTVLDIDGRPAVGVSVSALYPRLGGALGERQYTNAPGVLPAVTDDRGVYRIYGLPAGEYIVAAQPFVRLPAGGAVEVRMMLPGNTLSRTMALSEVFHPGSADLGRASRVPVRAAEERAGVDVQLEYVPLATIAGMVQSPAGWPPARVTLWRTDEMAQPQTGQVQSPDGQGRFVFRAVRPGNYRIAARATEAAGSGRGGAPPGEALYGSVDVAVIGDDVDGIAVPLTPGLTISGRVVVEATRTPAPSLSSQLRVNAPAALSSASGGWPMPPVIVEGDTFRISGVVPGRYRVLGGGMQGTRAPIAGSWWLKSIVAGGRDLLDAPLNLQQSIDDAVVTFTDRASEIAGTVRDATGAPVTNRYVVAFPVDRTGWFINSRRVAPVSLNRDGQYTIRNLPPGEYRLTVEIDQLEWVDPAVFERVLPTATPLRVTGPEKYTVDLVLR